MTTYDKAPPWTPEELTEILHGVINEIDTETDGKDDDPFGDPVGDWLTENGYAPDVVAKMALAFAEDEVPTADDHPLAPATMGVVYGFIVGVKLARIEASVS